MKINNKKEAEEFSSSNHINYTETSAKTASNCVELFANICETSFTRISKSPV